MAEHAHQALPRGVAALDVSESDNLLQSLENILLRKHATAMARGPEIG
jgi:hypothetical protein